MLYQHTNERTGGILRLRRGVDEAAVVRRDSENLIHILWNTGDDPVCMRIDGYTVTLDSHYLATLTFFHRIDTVSPSPGLAIFSFNREYYCIRDHDAEVSCNGLIFFGAQDVPVLSLPSRHRDQLSLLLQMFVHEFEERDTLQGEMLLVLLKRLIIICTRIAKEQSVGQALSRPELDLYRRFNYMVDLHFRKTKTVAEYSAMLGRAPKTLANLFRRLGRKTPLEVIHDRVILESRRLLLYSDKTAHEIAYELGYGEPATFFKLFRKYVGESPQQFRESKRGALGTFEQ